MQRTHSLHLVIIFFAAVFIDLVLPYGMIHPLLILKLKAKEQLPSFVF